MSKKKIKSFMDSKIKLTFAGSASSLLNLLHWFGTTPWDYRLPTGQNSEVIQKHILNKGTKFGRYILDRYSIRDGEGGEEVQGLGNFTSEQDYAFYCKSYD